MVDALTFVEGEPQLSELDRYRGVDPRLVDPLDRGEVFVGGRARLIGVRNAFPEEIEDASDPLSVELLDDLDGVLEVVAGDEPLDDVLRQATFGYEPVNPWLLRGPQHQAAEHCLPYLPSSLTLSS